MSLHLHKVPHFWRESIIVPVPKNNVPQCLNEYRPVALTSLIMKTFERVVKDKLLSMVQENLDPFQFAYRHGRGVDDAISTLLNMILAHLRAYYCFLFSRSVFISLSLRFSRVHQTTVVGGKW